LSNKSKSVSTATRDRREGEEDGKTYHFIDMEELQKRKSEGKLLQYIEFAGNAYAYEKSEFLNVDEIVVLMGGSGTGKDTVVDEIILNDSYEFAGEKVKFVISVPSSALVFDEYIKSVDGKSTMIYLEVDEPERLRRIISGEASKKIKSKLGEDYEVEVTVNKQLEVSISALSTTKEPILYLENNEEIKLMISESIERIKRDGDKFQVELDELTNTGNTVKIINVTTKTVPETANMIVKSTFETTQDKNTTKIQGK